MQNEKITLRKMLPEIGMLLDVQPMEGLVYASMDRDSDGSFQKIRMWGKQL